MNIRENILRPIKRTGIELKHFSVQRSQHVPFIVITKERSGSTVFMDLLATHPAVLVDHHDFFLRASGQLGSMRKELFLPASQCVALNLKFATTTRV